VLADFALIDYGALNRINELDRVFDGDDVKRLLAVIKFTSVAIVVVLPWPAGPVISTRPWVMLSQQENARRKSQYFREGITSGITRKVPSIPRCCRQMFARNRPTPFTS